MARISRIQKAIPLAHTTVAACICFSAILIVVPNPLKIASAIAILFSPATLEHKQVIDLPTEIAVLGMLLIILAIIAMIDYFWQRHTHIQSLRMTKQEVKDEYKQTEGSPEVKAKIRRMQMETAANAGRQQAALDDVPDATAVITNPTHFAVALKYEVGSSEAPKILAMGRGNMAHQIIERANGADVTVFRSPLLARALYYTGEIGAEIAEQLYQAVAVVLAYLYRVDKGEVLAEPEVEIPESLRFTENGQPLKGENSNRANYEA